MEKYTGKLFIRTQGGVQPCLMLYLRQIFSPDQHPPTQNAAKLIKLLRSYRKKLNDSPFTKNPRSITTSPSLTARTNNNLRLKVPDWRLRAYTDGSCLTYKSQECIGAGIKPETKQPSMLTLAELG